MKKIIYIVSEINKALAFEWVAQYLDKEKFQLSFVLLGDTNTAISNELKRLGIRVTEIQLGSKPALIFAFFRVLFHLKRVKPDIVHTHLFYANMIGLTTAWILRIPKRVVTRHHAMIHYDEHPQGIKWDKYINHIATHIVAISLNTKEILKFLDKADERKIRLIHHGFDLAYFSDINLTRVQALKRKYGLEGSYPVVGVISRYLLLKGIEYIIDAFNLLRRDFAGAQLVLANASGSYSETIKKKLKNLPNGSYVEIEFENDLAALYQIFNIYVHTPKDSKSESFGQTYVEALASGIPSIFTLSGVAPEFIVHENNALVVPFQDSNAIYISMQRILSEAKLRETLSSNGRLSANLFSLECMMNSLTQLYEE
ncbi:hypothetical protein WSM22_13510 [Cytophagales bacterium WSM2-2]|nr:hypothetical protein WSM22_13510 [Cytophagales bacterium WSM2-2]